jgi:hypothetical protein
MADDGEPSSIHGLAELETAIGGPAAYVRYSKGPQHDLGEASIDTESGLELPGLSVNPLDPEPWWTRPTADWLARQLCQYKHLRDRNRRRKAWLVRGRVVGRGPDCEPLLDDVEFTAELSDELLVEAQRRYRERFDVGRGPEGHES